MKVFSLIMLILLSLIVLVIALYTIIGFVCYKLSLARRSTAKRISKSGRKLKNDDKKPSWWDSHPTEKVTIKSEEDLTLVGHFLKNQSDKVVIIMHGFGSDWIEMDGYAKMFYKRNFNVLAVSARAHGESEGDMVGMGWLDRLDLLRWIEFANEKVPNARIVLFGVSMGASAVCMTLGEEMGGNVVCAIEDCGFDNVFKEICYVYRKKLKFTSTLLFKIFYKWTKRARGFDLKKGDAVKALKKAKTPVLFIHGGDDTFVPTQMVYNLYEALEIIDKRLYICEGATHAKSFQTDEARYEMKVDKFLTKHGL